MLKKFHPIILTFLMFTGVALSQTDAEIKRFTTFDKPANAARVAILGTFHFHNPGADYAKFESADILSDRKQKEIAEVVKRISQFKPTKIAIEWTADRTEETDQKYSDFLAERFSITEGDSKTIGNEVYQLGFRLASDHGHKGLFLVDHSGGMDIGSVLTFAKENDPEYAKRFQTTIDSIVGLMNQMQQSKSILEILRTMNKEDSLKVAHSVYIDMATVGSANNYVGADVVSDWYKRNLKIYANLSRIAEPNDRILLIIGQGHKPILQQLVRDSPNMELIDVMKYLK